MKKLTDYFILLAFFTFTTYGEEYSIDKYFGEILKHSGKLGKILSNNFTTDAITRIYIPLSGYDNDLCRNHSLLYRDNLFNNTPWAMRMLDSSSKVPDGLTLGNVMEFGNYDECLQIENIVTEFGKFGGQHCVAQISLPGSNIPPIRGQASVVNPKKKREPLALSGWSVCVPSSCRAEDVEAHLGVAMSPLSVRVDAITCNTRAKNVAFTPLDWFAIALLSFFAILVILSTSYDLISTDSAKRRELLVAYSLYTNGNKLLNASAGKDSLPAVCGVRFLTIMWVILGNRFQSDLNTYSINRLDHDIWDWTHTYIVNTTLALDSFLLVSGILVCYVFLKEMEAGGPFRVPAFYLQRYLRLTPAFAVMILLTVTLFPYIGDGPFWNITTQHDKDVCLVSWWSSLLYISNYLHPTEICMSHTWYLSLEMQLFCLSPLILYPLWKYPKVGKVTLAALLGIGLTTAFVVPYINKFDSQYKDNISNYIPTHTRFTPWLIGIGLGYLLHQTKNSTIRLSRMSVILGWLLAVALLLTSLLLQHRFNEKGHIYERLLESLYLCLMRPAWALGLAWVIFACLKGYGGLVNTFLSWSVFQIMGNFTYTLYLVYYPIQGWIAASSKTPDYVNDTIMYSQYFGDVALSLIAAALLLLIFESPAVATETLLYKTFEAWQSTNKKPSIENSVEEKA